MGSKPKCSVSKCDRLAKSRGLCNMHYQRWWKTGDAERVRRQWEGYERPVCSVDGCEELAHARGFCTIHAARSRRHGDPLAGRRPNAKGETEERFWSLTDRKGPEECWPWLGTKITVGYGVFVRSRRDPQYAHRASYEMFVGPIPDGLTIDHTCHNRDPDCPGGKCPHRLCVNPAHLEPVTSAENLRRGRERLRS